MNILLGVTGSIAAKLTPKIQEAFIKQGHEVNTIYTESATKLIRHEPTPDDYFDEDEWSYHDACGRVLHIDRVKWADRLVIAPCTANTLAKINSGICDNLLTCCVRAWPYEKRGIILAPAMNTEMWNKQFIRDARTSLVIQGRYAWVSPQYKVLYCGDAGIGAMADIDDIISATVRTD